MKLEFTKKRCGNWLRYKGTRRPKCGCLGCWLVWVGARQLSEIWEEEE